MTENLDEALEESDQIRILEDSEPKDSLIKLVGTDIQVDFQDRELLQNFLGFLDMADVRVEVGNNNVMFYWKKENNDGGSDD